jgi:molybdenum cofactor cytidylyltransferase
LISAIVLAAGKSERMGTPKALLSLRGKTFLENILDAISRSSVGHIVVVVGHHKNEIEPYVRPPAKLVFNPIYEQGMITSLQAGIRVLPADTSAALLFLVDHPVVESETIEQLILHQQPDRIVAPTYKQRRGHPVLFGAKILEEILMLSPDEGANIVVRKDPGRVVHIAIDSPGVLADIDTPEDFRNLQNEYEPR